MSRLFLRLSCAQAVCRKSSFPRILDAVRRRREGAGIAAKGVATGFTLSCGGRAVSSYWSTLLDVRVPFGGGWRDGVGSHSSVARQKGKRFPNSRQRRKDAFDPSRQGRCPTRDRGESRHLGRRTAVVAPARLRVFRERARSHKYVTVQLRPTLSNDGVFGYYLLLAIKADTLRGRGDGRVVTASELFGRSSSQHWMRGVERCSCVLRTLRA